MNRSRSPIRPRAKCSRASLSQRRRPSIAPSAPRPTRCPPGAARRRASAPPAASAGCADADIAPGLPPAHRQPVRHGRPAGANSNRAHLADPDSDLAASQRSSAVDVATCRPLPAVDLRTRTRAGRAKPSHAERHEVSDIDPGCGEDADRGAQGTHAVAQYPRANAPGQTRCTSVASSTMVRRLFSASAGDNASLAYTPSARTRSRWRTASRRTSSPGRPAGTVAGSTG